MSLENHSAPGPAAGYAFEFERALHWLARSSAGFLIGIETDDDVAIRHQDGSRTLEQNKHSIQEDAEPFGNRSKDLWNTLSIWVNALEDGELDATKTRFLMVTNKALPDCIAKQISQAKTDDEITACLQELKLAAVKPSETIRAYTDKVLAATSEPHLRAVIKHCELADAASGASGPDLRRQTIAELPIPNWFTNDADSIANELLRGDGSPVDGRKADPGVGGASLRAVRAGEEPGVHDLEGHQPAAEGRRVGARATRGPAVAKTAGEAVRVGTDV